MGKYNLLKGQFLEMVVQRTLEKFNNEEVDGHLFGKTGILIAPRMDYVDSRYVKGDAAKQYQIDAFAVNNSTSVVWLCECKYRLAKMDMETVKKAEEALEAFRQQQIREGREPSKVQIWLVSVGGFTDEVIEYVKDKDNIYCSDYDAINFLYKKYGGGFDIPLFCKE